MTTTAVDRTATRGPSVLQRVRHPTFAVWFPLAVYAATRLIDVVFILIAARHQIALSGHIDGYHLTVPSPAAPGYAHVASNWDGQWYLSIANHGYPTAIPRDTAGHALQNQWGFYPVYPLLVGAIMRITGLGFSIAAPLLSSLLGGAAVTVMFRLVSRSLGRFAASATVLLACTYMAAPSMQIAYTESLALLLLCTALLLLRNRRYGWLVPVLMTLALTRPVVLAFVPVLIVHGVSRWRRRPGEQFSVPDRWRLVGLGCLAILSTGLWPAIAAARTGDPMAYTETMISWGTTSKLRVLIAFPALAWETGGAIGLAFLICIMYLVAGIVLRNGATAWGPEIRAWAGFYPLYLLLATAPGSSTIRHLLLAFPLMWPFPEETSSTSQGHRRMALVGMFVVCGLLAQWVWISRFLVVSALPVGWFFP